MKLEIKNQQITITQRQPLVSGTVNVYTAEFSFDSAWDGYTPVAVFESAGVSGKVSREAAISHGKCTIPWEVLLPGSSLRIGVYGVSGDKRLPTIYADSQFVALGAEQAEESAEYTPSVIEQFVSRVAEDRGSAEAAADRAEAAAGLAEKSKASASEYAEAASAAAKQAGDNLEGINGLYENMQDQVAGAVKEINLAGDAQVERVTAEGQQQIAGAKAEAEAAAQSALDAALAKQELSQTIDDVAKLKGDLTDLRNETETPLAPGKFWTTTSDGAGWSDGEMDMASIASIEIETEVNSIVVDLEKSYRDILVEIEIPAISASAYMSVSYQRYGSTSWYLLHAITPSTSAARMIYIRTFPKNRRMFSFGIISSGRSNAVNSVNTSGYGLGSSSSFDSINKIKLSMSSSVNLPVSTKINVYGVEL
ncbi:MAG: hypothetical protein ACI3W8_03835 [Oscillospiraceae bacterium]